VAAPAAAHGHSHGGAPCTDASHGHGHGHAHAHAHGGDSGSDEDDSLSAALRGGNGSAAADSGLLVRPPGASYAWGQDADSVTVELPVPAGTRAADVKCVIAAARVDCAVGSLPAAQQALLAGAFAGRVSREDSSWSLVDDNGQRTLVLSLAKEGGARAARWPTLLQ
jgi:hypothetical protein